MTQESGSLSPEKLFKSLSLECEKMLISFVCAHSYFKRSHLLNYFVGASEAEESDTRFSTI